MGNNNIVFIIFINCSCHIWSQKTLSFIIIALDWDGNLKYIIKGLKAELSRAREIQE